MQRLLSVASSLFAAVAALATILGCAAASGPALADEPLPPVFCGDCNTFYSCEDHCRPCCAYMFPGSDCTGCFCPTCAYSPPPGAYCYCK